MRKNLKYLGILKRIIGKLCPNGLKTVQNFDIFLLSGQATYIRKVVEVEDECDHDCFATLQATPTSIRCYVICTKSLFVYNFLELDTCPTFTLREKKETKKDFPVRKEINLSFSDTESSEKN